MNVYRVLVSHLLRKAGPVGLSKEKVPAYDDTDYYRDQRQTKHRNYWKFMDDHRVELSSDEHNAVQLYRGYSDRLNNHLRGRGNYVNMNPMNNPEYLDRQAEHISKAVLRSPLKRPVTVWRSLKFSWGEPITDKIRSMGLLKRDKWDGGVDWVREPKKAELDSLAGFKFREPAFSSTTLIPDGKMWKNGMIRLRILLDRGQPALVTNSSYWFNEDEKDFDEGKDHKWAQEHELLLDKNTLFEVESARFEKWDARNHKTEGQLYLTVRVVD